MYDTNRKSDLNFENEDLSHLDNGVLDEKGQWAVVKPNNISLSSKLAY